MVVFYNSLRLVVVNVVDMIFCSLILTPSLCRVILTVSLRISPLGESGGCQLRTSVELSGDSEVRLVTALDSVEYQHASGTL